MGMTLMREGEDFAIDLPGWHFALELGRRYGWLPAGTEPPDEFEPDEDEAEDSPESDEDAAEDFLEDGGDDDDEEVDALCQGWPWDYIDNAGRKVGTDDAR